MNLNIYIYYEEIYIIPNDGIFADDRCQRTEENHV